MSTENIIALVGLFVVVIVGFAALITRLSKTEIKVETLWNMFIGKLDK